ncbi:hypothetical protein QFC21_000648 [Naganishia friedmannii]|uniref:Uncharacterized protein n=1 Tax=Naganishia friedmannii TaxID=89922 RepID=A0ACC2WDN5_9TREE|nr:hypothetical protein QFC21_000648 [Naganishia friedmannii]
MPPTSLPAPSTTTSQSLSRLRSESAAPLSRVTQSFDTHSARLFRQSMPPVPAFVPQTVETVAQRMGKMIDGLALVVELREARWEEREDAVWVFSTLGMGIEGEEMPAVVRSCLSWSVMAPAQDEYAALTTGFDDQPSILAQWMRMHACVEEFDLERVLYSVASADSGGGGFETIEAVRRFFFHLHDPALGALYGDTLLDALLGTFDLDLIAPGVDGREECGWMYWFISRVAGDRLRMGQEEVDGRGQEGQESWRAIWSRAWAEVGDALFLAFTFSDIEEETRTNAACSSSSLGRKSRREAVFEYRFGSFMSAMVDDAGEPLSPSYEEYVAACEQVTKIPSHSPAAPQSDALRKKIQQSFGSARDDFQAVHSHLSKRRPGGRQQHNLIDSHKVSPSNILAGP